MNKKLITKRDGTQEPFDLNKIIEAVDNAFKSCGYDFAPQSVVGDLTEFCTWGNSVEDILHRYRK